MPWVVFLTPWECRRGSQTGAELWACFFTPSNCSSWSRTLLWSLPLSNLLRPTHFLSGLCPFTFDSALLGPSFWSCFCWPSESASLLKQYQVGTSSLGKSIHSLCLASAQLPYWTHTAAYHVFIPCFLSHSSFKIMSLAAIPSSQPFFTIPNSWSLFLVLCQYPWLLFSIYALPFFSFSFFPLFTSLPFQPQPKFLLQYLPSSKHCQICGFQSGSPHTWAFYLENNRETIR